LPVFEDMTAHGFSTEGGAEGGAGRALRARMRRRWRVRTAHVLPYLEASALMALALAAGAWLGHIL
jgi:hypothetical protein